MVAKGESWLETSDVLSLFPTFVWNIQLKKDNYEAVNRKILTAVQKLREGLAPLAPGEAWQSGQRLQKLEEFSDLVLHVNEATRRVLKFLKIAHDAVEITGCWANVNTKGSLHGIHAHPNNFLSGVYYVKVQPGADTINFHDPRSQAAIIRPPVTELTAQNTDQVVVKVNNGTLLIFPSYLHHSVPPNESEDERISVSFNVMFSSFSENLSTPLW